MNRGELRTEFGQLCPDSPATTTQQDIWSQQGADYIAGKLRLFPTSGSINIVASTNYYDLISNFTTFLNIDRDGGVHYYDGTDYKPLKIVSKNWLETYIPDWRNAAEDEPVACYREGKYLFVYPTPSTSVTSGLKVYYFASPDDMAANTSDPFNSRTDLINLHPAVVAYMAMKAKRGIGEYPQAEIHKRELEAIIREQETLTNDDLGDEGIFRPYHKAPSIVRSDPSMWGIE